MCVHVCVQTASGVALRTQFSLGRVDTCTAERARACWPRNVFSKDRHARVPVRFSPSVPPSESSFRFQSRVAVSRARRIHRCGVRARAGEPGIRRIVCVRARPRIFRRKRSIVSYLLGDLRSSPRSSAADRLQAHGGEEQDGGEARPELHR